MFRARQLRVEVDRDRVRSRREFLRQISAGSLAAGLVSWTDLVQLQAEDLRRRGKACILLWMSGGPSQFETFSPKPTHANGGETQAISTNVPGIEIAANFPRLAQQMHHLALVRSMTSKEGNHQRASFYLHTGYLPTASVKHPTLGSLVSQQLADEACELPSFVRIGNRGRNDSGAGFLGVGYDPFALDEADRLPPNVEPTTPGDRFQRRLGLLSQVDEGYAARGGAPQVGEHRRLYAKTARMVQSPQMQAFDLEREPNEVREAYGRTKLGNACLLARRLVETGVSCVEVVMGGWDTHDDNFNRVRNLAGEVDQPFAHLLVDLQSRGMLDQTLVVWMGEFGRTPRINPRGGRDHYPKAFNVALAGGGVQGGRVIGSTDPAGAEVVDRPVAVVDLFQSFSKSLGLDPNLENMSPIGRPIRVVDGGSPVDELFA